MDILPDGPRVAFSFHAGTFDLQGTCPSKCMSSAGARSQTVRLDRRFERMFSLLRDLGMVLASASSGPLSLTGVWLQPAFQRIPESDILIETETGCELRTACLNSALAVIEQVNDQQLASLQFLDSTGRAVLKLQLTSGSDLVAFEQLVVAHAASPVQPREHCQWSGHRQPLSRHLPDAATVRRLWAGLSRTTPCHFFPGLEGISRHAALSVAGADLAWPVTAASVKEAMEQVVQLRSPLDAAVRNHAVVFPAAFRLTQSEACGRGHAWSSDLGQFALQAGDEAWEAWAVCRGIPGDEDVFLEFYDAEDRFCGCVGLRADASARDYRVWSHALQKRN